LSYNQQLLVWDCRGEIGVIAGAGGQDCDREDGVRAAARILEIITAYHPGLRAVVGVGCPQRGLAGIRKGCRQAVSAALVARSKGYPQKICHFSDIGIYKLLANFGGEEQAREYVRETLGKLMEYDRCKGTELMRTLEEILQTANLKETAAKLFLHYNTVVRQKHRIEEILGASLDDAETRLMLAAASKLHNLGR
jgi:Regulator of polyketide synthase expression